MSAERQPLSVSTVAAGDGTQLSVTRITGGQGIPLLVCNGVGASLSLWESVLEGLSPQRASITWDYRGLNSSGPSPTDGYGPEVQAGDACDVLDTLGVDEVVVAGWSSGTRVALQLAAEKPNRVKALVLVCGGNGYDLRRLAGLEIGPILPATARLLRPFHGALAGPVRSLMSRPEAAGVVRQSGLIQATADTSKLLDLFRTMVDNDLRVQFATFEAIAGSTDPKLPAHISCPALLVGGDRDRFVTPAHLRRTQASLHDARLEIYERASHYLPLEHPHRLTADIDAFLKEVL